jgi:hypothetical protein
MTVMVLALLAVASAGSLGLTRNRTAQTGEPQPIARFKTGAATFMVAADGSLCRLDRNSDGRDYLAPGEPAPLLQVRVAGKLHAPDRAEWHPRTHRLDLFFGTVNVTTAVSILAKQTHVVLELVDVQPKASVELVLWGPYPTTIGETVGEVVGVVRNREFAVGIQALNTKTLGGYPANENDIESEWNADDRGFYPDLPDELKKDQHFRGDTAVYKDFGSALQAYCRNRDQDRIVANWGYDRYLAPAYDDGGVVGSKIALFGCPASDALKTIGKIEVAEGLPHAMLDGVWAKEARNATCSYLIVDFSEDNVDLAIEMTKKAGLSRLYHSSPFETWGHFKLKPEFFPHGRAGLKACIDKARKAGVQVGFHTLSNFITPNDPYVTPKPDPRLARVGSSALAAAVDATAEEIPVESPDYFTKASPMSTVQIDDELIHYEGVSAASPWRLLKCKRGAWGTYAGAHENGAPVDKLMDHGYNVFLTDAALSVEVAHNIAKLCSEVGSLQISMDGLEGNWSTGMGQYGRTLFTAAWYGALAPAVKDQINDASNPGHYNWHIAMRMNWGEPWYAGFRESQTIYRFKNQMFFERNLMPRMLGWFSLGPNTTLADAEWMLARAAGFDAGFALVTGMASTAQLEADPSSADALKRYGALPAILEAVRQWETARLSGAFPPEIKAQLRDNTREFHLEPVGRGQWDLYATENGKRGKPIRVGSVKRR